MRTATTSVRRLNLRYPAVHKASWLLCHQLLAHMNLTHNRNASNDASAVFRPLIRSTASTERSGTAALWSASPKHAAVHSGSAEGKGGKRYRQTEHNSSERSEAISEPRLRTTALVKCKHNRLATYRYWPISRLPGLCTPVSGGVGKRPKLLNRAVNQRVTYRFKTCNKKITIKNSKHRTEYVAIVVSCRKCNALGRYRPTASFDFCIACCVVTIGLSHVLIQLRIH